MNQGDGWSKREGGYVFISHAHKDISEVRKLRNRLEEQGFEPLCFYLKCLTDEDEVEGLIKREIDAREWFVYVDSPNARTSRWVQKERKYIDEIGTKKIMVFRLDDEKSMEAQADRIMKSMRVFLSFSGRDVRMGKTFRDELLTRDLQVFDNTSVMSGQNFAEYIETHLSEAAENGCLVLLLSKTGSNSIFILNQISLFISKNSRGLLIPIILGDFKLPDDMKYYLGHLQAIYLSEDPTTEEVKSAVDIIEKLMLKRYEVGQGDI